MARSQFQITDYSNEKSNVTVNAPNLSAANFDAQEALRLSLQTAINNLSIGVMSRTQVTNVIVDEPGIPTNPFAQREMKWLVSYTGNTSGKLYQLEIPAPSLTDNLAPNSDLADLTSTDWAAFVTAFEAYARTPDSLIEGVTVIQARLVGRNI